QGMGYDACPFPAPPSQKNRCPFFWVNLNELTDGYEWIVDADLKDFFGAVEHAKLLTLVGQRVSESRVPA
ncbi:hypothetical protein ACFFG5_09440, partial [Paraburkholderia humisilvae]